MGTRTVIRPSPYTGCGWTLPCQWFGQLDDSDWSRRDSTRTGVWIGGCKGERDEQGDEDRVGRRRRGVDAGGPAPRLSFDRRPTAVAGHFGESGLVSRMRAFGRSVRVGRQRSKSPLWPIGPLENASVGWRCPRVSHSTVVLHVDARLDDTGLRGFDDSGCALR
jgi:hypothetical protein